MTVLGAGLLVGTALAVIIPEGVNALISDHHPVSKASTPTTEEKPEHSNLHAVIGISLVLGKIIYFNSCRFNFF